MFERPSGKEGERSAWWPEELGRVDKPEDTTYPAPTKKRSAGSKFAEWRERGHLQAAEVGDRMGQQNQLSQTDPVTQNDT